MCRTVYFYNTAWLQHSRLHILHCRIITSYFHSLYQSNWHLSLSAARLVRRIDITKPTCQSASKYTHSHITFLRLISTAIAAVVFPMWQSLLIYSLQCSTHTHICLLECGVLLSLASVLRSQPLTTSTTQRVPPPKQIRLSTATQIKPTAASASANRIFPISNRILLSIGDLTHTYTLVLLAVVTSLMWPDGESVPGPSIECVLLWLSPGDSVWPVRRIATVWRYRLRAHIFCCPLSSPHFFTSQLLS